METVESMSAEEFSEKFIGATVSLYSLLVVSNILIMRHLNKKTLEQINSQKDLEEALEQQKTFIFSFSHELRNPLNSLFGNLQLISMSQISLETRKMVNTAQICAEVLLQLVNNILDIGKHDLGKLEIDPSPNKIHSSFQRMWKISSEQISQKNLKGHIKIEKRVPPVLLLDGHRLDQIMLNLIGNAIKFTESGSISITVQWLESKPSNDECFQPEPFDDMNEGVFEKEENISTVGLDEGDIRQEQNGYFLLSSDKTQIHLSGVQPRNQHVEGILKIVVKDTGCGMTQAALDQLFKKFLSGLH